MEFKDWISSDIETELEKKYIEHFSHLINTCELQEAMTIFAKCAWEARDKEISVLKEKVKELEEYKWKYEQLCK